MIWGFFLRKSSFTFLLLAALAAAGIYGLVSIPKESNPEVEIPVVVVQTSFPGAPAADVEQLVTDPLEAAIDGRVDNISALTSVSRQSVSQITVEFDADANLNTALQEVRNEVEKAKTELPDEANTPSVGDVSFSDQPILTVSVASSRPAPQLIPFSDRLVEEIEAIDGVSRAQASGVSEREAQVTIQRDALRQYNLSLTSVVQSIRRANASLPVGSIESSGRRYTVSFRGDITDPGILKDIPVAERGGSPVYLRDIALVSDGVAEKKTISRVSTGEQQSQQAITLSVYKNRGGDITRITERVHNRLEEMQTKGGLLANEEVLVLYDLGEFIREDLNSLGTTGLQTTLLVTIVLLVAVGWRESLLAGASIPISFLIAFAGLYWSGNTLNFISLFSLVLAIGIMVDSAIVMTEGIHERIQRGFRRREAAWRALREIHMPLTAGFLTTVAVFAPLFLISGITGEFIASIPFTVIFVLTASLFVTLAILPLFASRFFSKGATNRLERIQEQFVDRARRMYSGHLDILLSRRAYQRVLLGALTVLFLGAVSLPALGIVPAQFFPSEDADLVFVNIELPQNTVLSRTDTITRRASEAVFSHPAIASISTTVGASSQFQQDGREQGSHLATITAILRDGNRADSDQVVQDLQRDLRNISEADIEVFQQQGGPPGGDPVQVRFFGDNLTALNNAARESASALEDIEGTRNINTSVEQGGTEYQLTINRARAAQVGIDAQTIAQTLRTAIEGTEATTIRRQGDDIDVMTRLNLAGTTTDPHRANRATIDTVRTLDIPTEGGNSVPLGSLVDITVGSETQSIRHKDRDRYVTISSALQPGYRVGEVISAFKQAAENQGIGSDLRMEIGGEQEDINETFTELFVALIAGMLLILGILVLQFNSFRQTFFIISIVPLSLIGILAGLAVTGAPLSFPAILGIIALAGVVVNNAIILVAVINRLRTREPNTPLKEIVIEGATSRLRPVVLTAVTTIIGVIPLLFASGIWRPLVYTLIFGLSFSVIIILALVPLLYYRYPGKPMPQDSNTH